MPCGSHKTAKTKRRETAAQKAKISASRKGRHLSASARRKLADAAKCHAATKGHCAKPRPSSTTTAAKTAAAKRVAAAKKARGYKVCKAVATTRHSKSTPRRLHVVVRHHVIRQVRTSQRAYRESWSRTATHVQGRAIRLSVRKAARKVRLASTRPRAAHAARLHCHIVYRKSTAKHPSVSKCPRSKRR